MRTSLVLSALSLGVFAQAPVQALSSDVDVVSPHLGWLTGDWVASTGRGTTREESWSPSADGAHLGWGRGLRDDRQTDWEFLRIEVVDGVPTYFATPGEGSTTAFPLVESGPKRAVFAAPDHDFPTRLAYVLLNDGRLEVDVRGPDGDGFTLRYRRSEDPSRPSATRIPDLRDLWDFDDPAASERVFRGLIPRAESAGDQGLLLEIRTQVARSLGLQRRFEDALTELDAVDTSPPASRTRRVSIRSNLERGRVLRSAGRAEEARPFFIAAWKDADAAGMDGLAVDAAHMVALVEAGEEALRWNELALELAERSEQEAARRWRASLYNNIGWTHHDAGRFDEALASFELVVPLREAQGRPEGVRAARWAVARALRSLGRCEEALVEQRRLFEEWAVGRGSDGYVEEEIAECLLTLDRAEEAAPWFARAHQKLSAESWMSERESDRLARLLRLSGGASGAAD